MSRIETAYLYREMELTVKYIDEPAEADVGAAHDAEILSIKICGVEIPVTAEQLNAIKSELLETV